MNPRLVRFDGFEGIHLVADVWGDDQDWPVLLMHGGGQTRHAWGSTAETLARKGWRAVSLDLRGHGDSEWALNGDYSFTAYAADCLAVIDRLGAPPVLIGASLGGVTAMLAEGASDRVVSSGLVIVDITHRSNPDGIRRIRDFMASGLHGFATLEDAAASHRGLHAESEEAGESGRTDEGAAPASRWTLVLALGPEISRGGSHRGAAARIRGSVRSRHGEHSSSQRSSCGAGSATS